MSHKRILAFYITLVALIVFGVACQQRASLPVDTTVVPETIEETPVIEESVVLLSEIFDAESLIPVNAVIKTIYEFDLDSDGKKEYGIEYEMDDVISKYGRPVQKAYLDVFRFTNGSWTAIKQDEIDRDMNEFRITVVHFDSSLYDYLLVQKPSDPHGYMSGYYVFGMTTDGLFEDLPIPKAYLHEEEYLETGDTWLFYDGVTVTPTALIEHYEVACESKEWTEPRFGGVPGDESGPCRILQVAQTITENGFSTQPEILVNATEEEFAELVANPEP
ncbi:MAG: hypothetical protein WC882_05260 [Candidatus Gracilibacteria bacterium]